MEKREREERKEESGIDRREFMRLVGIFGTTATLGGILAAPLSLSAKERQEFVVAQAAQEKEKAAKAKYKAIVAIEGREDRWKEYPVYKATMCNIGVWELKQAIERDSKGAIYIDIMQAGAIGTQIVAAKKVQQGLAQACSCSSQNAAALMPVCNVLDFPYVIGPEKNFWKLVYSKEVNDTIRAKCTEQGMIPLTFFPQLRALELRKDLDDIRHPDNLKGLKIRVTGSRLEQEAFKILPSKPTPIAAAEILLAMKEKAIDGLHVGLASTADYGLLEAASQVVDVNFMYNSDVTWIGTKWYLSLPANLREVIMEAAYDIQLFIHDKHEPLYRDQIGFRNNAPSNTIYKKSGAKLIFLSTEERKKWEEYLSFDRNSARFNPLVAEFGKHEFEIVRRVSQAAGDAEKKRWWKA